MHLMAHLFQWLQRWTNNIAMTSSELNGSNILLPRVQPYIAVRVSNSTMAQSVTYQAINLFAR